MTAAERLRTRLGRLRPGHVPAPVRVWVIGCWVATLGVITLLLLPGVTDSVSVDGVGVIASFTASPAYRIAMLVAASLVVGASIVWVLTRDLAATDPPTATDRGVREAVIVTASVIPALTLIADAEPAWAIAAAIPALGLVTLTHLPQARRLLAIISALGVLAAIPWLVLAVHQTTPAGSSPSSWIWVGLFGAAAAFAAFGSYYGVARAAESRHARLAVLFRPDLNAGIIAGIVGACVVVVVLRLTVARDLFPDPDPDLWNPFDRSPLSWLIAIVVAGLIIVVAVRAAARPLARFGERRVIAALAALGNLELIGSMIAIAVGMIVAAVSARVLLPTELPTDWLALVPLAKFAGVVVLLIVVVLPAFRGTASRWIGISTGIFLGALTLNSAIATARVPLPEPVQGFPATPVQVLLVMLAAAVVLAVRNLVRPRAVSGSLVARFAVVPLVAVHAGWLLPAAWSELGRVILIVGVLVALFWLMPPVSPDRTRHGVAVLGASLAQLVALLVFVLAIPSLFADGALTVLGLLWLSIPVIAALTIDTTAAIDTVKSTQPTMEDA